LQHLHLISFNIPEPPNYGGIIDVFYRIKAFYEAGIIVTLHCFYHDRAPAKELENWCEAIYYYRRKPAMQSISLRYPLMMKARRSGTLLQNLLQDQSPIFFEGIQTSYILNHPQLKNRIKAVKLHNIEWKYYQALGEAATNPLKKLFYHSESWRLYYIESIFHHAHHLLAVSRQEADYYNQYFHGVKRLPSFHGNKTVTAGTGKGKYLLYHGNLEIEENQKAVEFLLREIMPYVHQKLVIAGRNPSAGLIKQIEEANNVEVIRNPSDRNLDQMMKDAHIHVLPSFQNTGFKIKLINTLYRGRFCLVTPEMAEGSGLEQLCFIAKDRQAFINYVYELMDQPFTREMLQEREEFLNTYFNDAKNAKYIKNLLF